MTWCQRLSLGILWWKGHWRRRAEWGRQRDASAPFGTALPPHATRTLMLTPHFKPRPCGEMSVNWHYVKHLFQVLRFHTQIKTTLRIPWMRWFDTSAPRKIPLHLCVNIMLTAITCVNQCKKERDEEMIRPTREISCFSLESRLGANGINLTALKCLYFPLELIYQTLMLHYYSRGEFRFWLF